MKAVALVSGGIDSPVAAHLMLSRGADVVVLHMDNRPFSEGGECSKMPLLVKRLSEVHGSTIEAFQAPHGEAHQTIAAGSSEPRLRCVLCKRGMLRTAGRLALREGASAIVTGDSLGQVASQTLPNLVTEDSAVSMPVLRPLIGMDKVEIIDIAKGIGTYDISIMPGGCCTHVPQRPATGASPGEVLSAEETFGAEGLADQCLAGIKRIEL